MWCVARLDHSRLKLEYVRGGGVRTGRWEWVSGHGVRKSQAIVDVSLGKVGKVRVMLCWARFVYVL